MGSEPFYAKRALTPFADYQSWGCGSEPDEKKDKSGS
jgi:hypothetical protein